jgi:hypothetical protein
MGTHWPVKRGFRKLVAPNRRMAETPSRIQFNEPLTVNIGVLLDTSQLTLESTALIMACRTQHRRFLHATARQTPGLLQIALDGQLSSRCHRPMTFVASIAGFKMQTVAEFDERRYSINSRPGNILILLRRSRELPDSGTRGLDSLMATHAGRGSCNTHVLAGVRIRVTRLARHIRVCVCFVAERQRLCGWIR